MFKKKSLCIIGIAAALMLSACGQNEENVIVAEDGNVSNGDISIITDSEEGEKAELTRPPEEVRVELTIGVVKNDGSAMALSALAAENENDGCFEKYKFAYADNYTALAEQLKNKTIGVAILPPTKALDLYATDKSVKVLASISNMSYSIIGDGINSFSDLAGKKVYVSGDDKTSSCIMTKIIAYAGVKDCTVESVADNKTLFEMVKNGEAQCALVEEPYTSMLKKSGVQIHEYDFSEDWVNAAEGYDYCTGVLVATNEFLETNKSVVDYMLDDIERSLETINNDTKAYGENAVKFGFADDAQVAEEAYVGMDYDFEKDSDMRFVVNNMFGVFDNAGQDVLGTDVPDEGFYVVKD